MGDALCQERDHGLIWRQRHGSIWSYSWTAADRKFYSRREQQQFHLERAVMMAKHKMRSSY